MLLSHLGNKNTDTVEFTAASEPAGEYLESLGKTDLATLEEHEWLTLLKVVVTAYTDKLGELQDAPAA